MRHPIISQVLFAESPAGLATARFIIAHKIRNQRGVLEKYRQSLKRAEQYSDLQNLNHASYFLKRYEAAMYSGTTSSKKEILLLEARAAKQYWHMISVLCHTARWGRSARASDILNQMFNVGYHYLGLIIQKKVIESGLSPDTGILHANHRKNALVYDLMELWRQPIVDIVIVNKVRRKGLSDDEDNWQGILCTDIQRMIDIRRWRYKGRCCAVHTVIQREINSLKYAMRQNHVWKPAIYHWGRSVYCK